MVIEKEVIGRKWRYGIGRKRSSNRSRWSKPNPDCSVDSTQRQNWTSGRISIGPIGRFLTPPPQTRAGNLIEISGRKGCREVAHEVRSPIKTALATTEAAVVSCERKQILSLGELRACCSAVGPLFPDGVASTRQLEYGILMQKLKTMCNGLRPLLDCERLERILCGIEDLGRQSLQYLSA
jgi:hypothetical protein